MSSEQHHDNHGNTVAAWTAVVIMLVGCVLGALAFPMGSPTVFWVGVGVVVLGLVVGKVLQVMGYGASSAEAEGKAAA